MRTKATIYAETGNSLSEQVVTIKYEDGVFVLYDKSGDFAAKCKEAKPLAKHAWNLGAKEVGFRFDLNLMRDE